MTDRPTVEVILPRTGARVVLYEFLLNREMREVKKKLLSQAKVTVSENKEVKMDDFDPSITVDMQDMTIKLLIKEAYLDGVQVEDVVAFVDNLPSDDGDVLYSQADEITRGSKLTQEKKKK